MPETEVRRNPPFKGCVLNPDACVVIHAYPDVCIFIPQIFPACHCWRCHPVQQCRHLLYHASGDLDLSVPLRTLSAAIDLKCVVNWGEPERAPH